MYQRAEYVFVTGRARTIKQGPGLSVLVNRLNTTKCIFFIWTIISRAGNPVILLMKSIPYHYPAIKYRVLQCIMNVCEGERGVKSVSNKIS